MLMWYGLQQAILDFCRWQMVEAGVEVSKLDYQSTNWDSPKRMMVVRQHLTLKANVPGET